jgi:putative thioredoxin
MSERGFILDGKTAAPAAPGAPSGAAEIVDTTTQTFARDVLEASREKPVLVDFWAPWCEPCKQLQPALEKVVREAKGAVKLVKMNIEEHPAIPGQLGIRSIPAVLAFKDGRPLDGFMGAVPESQIRDFVARVAGPIEDDTAVYREEAEAARAAGDVERAAQIYSALLQADPTDVAAMAGLAHCLIDRGQLAEARQVLDMAAETGGKDPAVQSALAALELAEQAADLGDTAEIEQRLAQNPDDHQARYDLAVALGGAGRSQEALDHLFEIMKREREWNDGAAQKQLLAFFEVWGPKDPATVAGRRRLTLLLFS